MATAPKHAGAHYSEIHNIQNCAFVGADRVCKSVTEVHQILFTKAYLHASMQFTSISRYVQLFVHVATSHIRRN
jgi:hypothetical protein